MCGLGKNLSVTSVFRITQQPDTGSCVLLTLAPPLLHTDFLCVFSIPHLMSTPFLERTLVVGFRGYLDNLRSPPPFRTPTWVFKDLSPTCFVIITESRDFTWASLEYGFNLLYLLRMRYDMVQFGMSHFLIHKTTTTIKVLSVSSRQ